MEKILFILNPRAGGGRAKKLLPLIKEEMDKHSVEYKIIETTKPMEATEIAKEDKEFETIIAVGGDGTVNEVAKGIILRGFGRLGIIPGGTGNDMARSLNLPKKLEENLDIIIEGYERNIDIGRVNGDKFLNIASIGFDAEVVLNNIKIKQIIKAGFSYLISVIYTLLSYKKKNMEIIIDGKTIKEEVVLMAIGNGKYYGGGLQILPMAEVDNGLFSICIVSKANNLTLLRLFPTIFSGKHINLKKYVQIHEGRNIKIESSENFYLNIDGEILPEIKKLEFSMTNEKLRVICKKV